MRPLDALAAALRPALALDPLPVAAGLCIDDEERGILVYHLLALGRGAAAAAPLETVEIAAAESEALLSSAADGIRELGPGESDRFLRMLAERGVGRLASSALVSSTRALGAIFLGRRAGESFPARELDYLTKLARIVEPHVWSCSTDERFARGDRRRDALCELSRVINTSLDPRTVLHLARCAIGTIEGHRFSWIGLLDEGGATYRRYDRPEAYAGDGEHEAEPPGRAVAGSVLEALLRDGESYESPDLALRLLFLDDRELLARGVRRYVAVPLRAGGKVVGGFLFGSSDRLPPLRVDVWLYENIALQVALAIDNALHHAEIQRLSARREQQNVYLREVIQSEHVFPEMIGRSAAMRAVFAQIGRVAATDATVLISGPTGVGKELVARAIHEASRVKDQPMVKLNCAAIPEGMVESELFGHERGAFTSAVDRRIGRFELACNGTLFLDEIAELPTAVQAKLLRVLQNGDFERVGGTKTLTSNARIIAATNRDLRKAVENGSFRSDLFYRLNVFPIEVPALDERREDIPLLVQAFVEQDGRRLGKRFESVDTASLERLCALSWPGNVRELRHAVERAAILCDGPVLFIDADPVPERRPAENRRYAEPPSATLAEFEAIHIRTALERTKGVIEGPRGAAALLGLKGSTLRFRMKRLGIRRPER